MVPGYFKTTGVPIVRGRAFHDADRMGSQLVNLRPTDPLTFAAVAAALILVAFTAALIPARRAAAMDPTRALQAF